MRSNRLYRAVFAVLLSISLVGTFPGLAPAVAAVQAPTTLGGALSRLPSSLGSVTDRSGSQPSVVLLQDLHAHFGVQKNISGILQYLKNQRLNYGIAVEGAEGPIDLSVLTSFPNWQLRQRAATYLMREGLLTGAEHFAVTQGFSKALTGAEDQRYYDVHRQMFRKTYQNRSQIVASLKGLQADIRSLRPTILSGSVRQLQAKVDAFDRGEIGERELIAELSARGRPFGINADSLTHSPPERLYDDIQAVAFMLKLQMAANRAEKDLIQAEHDISLVLRVADLQATESEVRSFGPRINQFITLCYSLLAANGEKKIGAAQLREIISTSIDYYALALMRNAPLAERTLVLAAKRPVVLIAGGFHTQPIVDILKQKNISYAVITPRVAAITDHDHDLYVKRLMGEVPSAGEVIAGVQKTDRSRSLLARLRSRSSDGETLAIGGIATLSTLGVLAYYGGWAPGAGVPADAAHLRQFISAHAGWADAAGTAAVIGKAKLMLAAGTAVVPPPNANDPRLRKNVTRIGAALAISGVIAFLAGSALTGLILAASGGALLLWPMFQRVFSPQAPTPTEPIQTLDILDTPVADEPAAVPGPRVSKITSPVERQRMIGHVADHLVRQVHWFNSTQPGDPILPKDWKRFVDAQERDLPLPERHTLQQGRLAGILIQNADWLALAIEPSPDNAEWKQFVIRVAENMTADRYRNDQVDVEIGRSEEAAYQALVNNLEIMGKPELDSVIQARLGYAKMPTNRAATLIEKWLKENPKIEQEHPGAYIKIIQLAFNQAQLNRMRKEIAAKLSQTSEYRDAGGWNAVAQTGPAVVLAVLFGGLGIIAGILLVYIGKAIRASRKSPSNLEPTINVDALEPQITEPDEITLRPDDPYIAEGANPVWVYAGQYAYRFINDGKTITMTIYDKYKPNLVPYPRVVFPINREKIIGRLSEFGIKNDSELSRNHFMIQGSVVREVPQIRVMDLDSKYGTLVRRTRKYFARADWREPVPQLIRPVQVRYVDLSALPLGSLVRFTLLGIPGVFTLRVEDNQEVSIFNDQPGRVAGPMPNIASYRAEDIKKTLVDKPERWLDLPRYGQQISERWMLRLPSSDPKTFLIGEPAHIQVEAPRGSRIPPRAIQIKDTKKAAIQTGFALFVAALGLYALSQGSDFAGLLMGSSALKLAGIPMLAIPSAATEPPNVAVMNRLTDRIAQVLIDQGWTPSRVDQDLSRPPHESQLLKQLSLNDEYGMRDEVKRQFLFRMSRAWAPWALKKGLTLSAVSELLEATESVPFSETANRLKNYLKHYSGQGFEDLAQLLANPISGTSNVMAPANETPTPTRGHLIKQPVIAAHPTQLVLSGTEPPSMIGGLTDEEQRIADAYRAYAEQAAKDGLIISADLIEHTPWHAIRTVRRVPFFVWYWNLKHPSQTISSEEEKALRLAMMLHDLGKNHPQNIPIIYTDKKYRTDAERELLDRHEMDWLPMATALRITVPKEVEVILRTMHEFKSADPALVTTRLAALGLMDDIHDAVYDKAREYYDPNDTPDMAKAMAAKLGRDPFHLILLYKEMVADERFIAAEKALFAADEEKIERLKEMRRMLKAAKQTASQSASDGLSQELAQLGLTLPPRAAHTEPEHLVDVLAQKIWEKRVEVADQVVLAKYFLHRTDPDARRYTPHRERFARVMGELAAGRTPIILKDRDARALFKKHAGEENIKLLRRVYRLASSKPQALADRQPEPEIVEINVTAAPKPVVGVELAAEPTASPPVIDRVAFIRARALLNLIKSKALSEESALIMAAESVGMTRVDAENQYKAGPQQLRDEIERRLKGADGDNASPSRSTGISQFARSGLVVLVIGAVIGLLTAGLYAAPSSTLGSHPIEAGLTIWAMAIVGMPGPQHSDDDSDGEQRERALATAISHYWAKKKISTYALNMKLRDFFAGTVVGGWPIPQQVKKLMLMIYSEDFRVERLNEEGKTRDVVRLRVNPDLMQALENTIPEAVRKNWRKIYEGESTAVSTSEIEAADDAPSIPGPTQDELLLRAGEIANSFHNTLSFLPGNVSGDSAGIALLRKNLSSRETPNGKLQALHYKESVIFLLRIVDGKRELGPTSLKTSLVMLESGDIVLKTSDGIFTIRKLNQKFVVHFKAAARHRAPLSMAGLILHYWFDRALRTGIGVISNMIRARFSESLRRELDEEQSDVDSVLNDVAQFTGTRYTARTLSGRWYRKVWFLGLADKDKGVIEINRYLPLELKLFTIIHEALHLRYPDWDEQKINGTADEIMKGHRDRMHPMPVAVIQAVEEAHGQKPTQLKDLVSQIVPGIFRETITNPSEARSVKADLQKLEKARAFLVAA
jgi:hypothetical protein